MKRQLELYNYFNKKVKQYLFSYSFTQKTKIKKQNIIFLIMESYSKEFVGFYNNGEGYTPFLDSLMQHSQCFTNAYANGLKSIEALPAITASIPTLMINPFITSNYARNNFKSYSIYLNKKDIALLFFMVVLEEQWGFIVLVKEQDFRIFWIRRI